MTSRELIDVLREKCKFERYVEAYAKFDERHDSFLGGIDASLSIEVETYFDVTDLEVDDRGIVVLRLARK